MSDYVDNVACHAHPKYRDAILSEVAAAHRQHGDPPYTKALAAAHESGHIIIGLASGYASAFKRASVFEHRPGIWCGSNFFADGAIPAESATPLWAIKRGLFLLAGAMGETALGAVHPASSAEERTMGAMALKAGVALHAGHTAVPDEHGFTIDAVDFAPDVAMMERLAVVPFTLLNLHRAAFDRLRDQLARRGRLGLREIATLVAGVSDSAAYADALIEQALGAKR